MKKINLLSNKDDDIDGSESDNESKTKKEIIWSEPDEKEELTDKRGLLGGWLSFFKKAGKENRLIDKNRIRDSRRELIKLIKNENDQQEAFAGAKSERNKEPEKKLKKPNKINKSKPRSEISVPSKPKKARDESGPTKWEKLSISGTNLIKGEIISFFDWRKKFSVLLTAAISAFLTIAVVYGGLIFLENKEINKGRYFVDKINEMNQSIGQAKDYIKEILIFKEKMKLADELLGRHIYWTDFFEFLEKNTLADVYYSGFSGNIGGEYTLSATAKSFSAIAQQVKTMRNNSNVAQAKVSGGQSSAEGGGVGFQLELSVNPDIFKK
ncbi:hypothetical protein L6249_02565 [Candidatus Parcubacteria bacterium]|nr:hypothetical protein [Candidatus Parcubacteria bacterium]